MVDGLKSLLIFRRTFWSMLPAGVFAVEVVAKGYRPLYKSVTIISGKQVRK